MKIFPLCLLALITPFLLSSCGGGSNTTSDNYTAATMSDLQDHVWELKTVNNIPQSDIYFVVKGNGNIIEYELDANLGGGNCYNIDTNFTFSNDIFYEDGDTGEGTATIDGEDITLMTTPADYIYKFKKTTQAESDFEVCSSDRCAVGGSNSLGHGTACSLTNTVYVCRDGLVKGGGSSAPTLIINGTTISCN